jgi:hypothetical protein
MLVTYGGLVAPSEAAIPSVRITHCCLQRIVAAREMPEKLKPALDRAVKLADFCQSQFFKFASF